MTKPTMYYARGGCTMTQEEKLVARLKSLEDGVIPITICKKDGELYFWIVGIPHKIEGLKVYPDGDKMEKGKEV